VTDGRTDRQTRYRRKDRAMICVARVKVANFPPRVFYAPLKGFFLELGIGAMVRENRNDGLPDGRKVLR